MSQIDDDHKGLFRIGEIAEKAGVSQRTLRYYEEKDLLMPAETTEGGFRLYTKRQLHRVNLIKLFQNLGFSLSEIGDVLSPEPNGDKDEQLAYSRRVLLQQKEIISQRLSELKKKEEEIETALSQLEECEECPSQECPLECSNREAFL